MSTNKILLKFAKKGINLSPEAYNKVINAENPLDFASSLIVKLKGDKFSSKDLVSVSGETVDELFGITKTEDETTSQETLIEKSNEEDKQSAPETELTPEPTPQPTIKKETPQKQETKPTIETEKPTPQKQETESDKVVSIDELKKDSDKPEKQINQDIVDASETVEDVKIKFSSSPLVYDFLLVS